MAPPALRRSTPCSPADGSFKGANNWSRVAIVRPSSVPSTSKNKHQSSAGGGGDCFMRQKHSLRDGCCRWLANIYFKCKFYTNFIAQKPRLCASSSVFCVTATRLCWNKRRHDVSLGDSAISPAGRTSFMRGGVFRTALHPAAARGVVSLGRRIARGSRDAFHGGADHGSRRIRQRVA